MSRAISPSTQRRYGVAMVAAEWELSRAGFYRRPASVPQKRGPKTSLTDEALLEQIRAALAGSPFVGEGHRKAWARLRHAGVRTSKARVLRLMRENELLAPSRPQRVLGPRSHDGVIVTERPDQMWGTDATSACTVEDGQVTVFIAVDHCTAECVGIHAAKPGTRFEALEPLRQGVRARFGSYGEGVAEGLSVRHDHGSQYMSDAFQDELRFLGVEASPSFVRAPEGNGCAERFIRTLKEQLLWVRSFRDVEELRLALHEWAALYNSSWIIGRLGYLTPAEARRALAAPKAAA